MIDRINLIEALNFVTRNDLEAVALSNRKFAAVVNGSKSILKQRFYHLRSFGFLINFKPPFSPPEPFVVPAEWRDWRNATCFDNCQQYYNVDTLSEFRYWQLFRTFSDIRLVIYTHGSQSPILFDHSVEKHSDPTCFAHFLHLLWHIKDTIFDEECHLEFPFGQKGNSVRKLLDLWNAPTPLLKCSGRLDVRAYAELRMYRNNLLVPCRERIFSSPVIDIKIEKCWDPQHRARHFLRDLIQFFRHVTHPLVSDIDIRCGMRNFDTALDLGIEFEKAPSTLAPNGCITNLSEGDVKADYVLLGKFMNTVIGKLFQILLYNCFLRDGSEMYKCYRIWSEDANLAMCQDQ
ncbi:hypothetical protein Ddc_13002 [Ditylenchus destructor]|nr:hypothetical protein Ddc_13002 [Ditylenchus destructor]